MMSPLWSETRWSPFKYFINLIYLHIIYVLSISWITKCLTLWKLIFSSKQHILLPLIAPSHIHSLSLLTPLPSVSIICCFHEQSRGWCGRYLSMRSQMNVRVIWAAYPPGSIVTCSASRQSHWICCTGDNCSWILLFLNYAIPSCCK